MSTQNLYPHMIVGNVSKVSLLTVETLLIKYEIDPSDFYTDLLTAAAAGDPLSEFKSLAEAIIDTTPINSKPTLSASFPKFNEFIEMLATTDHLTITIPSGSDFDIIARERDFWDSLFAHYIVNTNAALIQDLLLAVKLIGLLKKVQDGTLTDKTSVFTFWNKCSVLYPNPPFPLPKVEPEVLPDVPGVIASPSLPELMTELEDLTSTYEEIVELFDFQLLKNKSEKLSEATFKQSIQFTIDEDKANESNVANAVEINVDTEYANYIAEKNPENLLTEFTAQLSENSSAVLALLNIDTRELNVNFASQRINAKSKKVMNQISKFVKHDKVVLIGSSLIRIDSAIYEDLICNPEATFSHCSLLHNLNAENPDKTYVQVLGMGYANIIRQTLLRYEADEVAHIENVLAGEKKEKTHRNLKTQEETFSLETEKSEETETDTKTTDRFELSKEINKLSASSSQFGVGVSLSASYGPVSLTADVGYASASSSSEASSSAVNNAKEITERAVNVVKERVLEKRSISTINEVEVTNVHGVDNSSNTEHISGFYYWVDKVYENQVYNLGKRLMLEFMVPEPAAYQIFNTAFSKKEGVTLSLPIHPSEYDGILDAPLKSHRDITRNNYGLWAALYEVQDVSTPPLDFITVSKAYSLDYTPGAKAWYDKEYNDLTLKEGYEANTAYIRVAFSSGSGRYISGFVGRKYFSAASTAAITPIPLSGETDLVPVSFRGHFTEFAMNIEILCKLSDKGFETWQMQTYNSIVNAYKVKKAEYDFQVSSLESGINISGQNPILNRKTEQTELKKWGIELLTLQRFNGFNAMKRSDKGHPEIDFKEAFKEGKFVKFFEQSIEWHNMTYLFYPYFWSPKQRWSINKNLSDTDTKFTDFLQAGYARVVVPVHNKFTHAILHYLNTGEIWEGKDLPSIDDELYLSIIEEIQEAEDNTSGDPQGDPWETRIPTNMVILSSEIPENLPGSD